MGIIRGDECPFPTLPFIKLYCPLLLCVCNNNIMKTYGLFHYNNNDKRL